MTLTTDKDNPDLHEIKENGQNKAYLVLSDEEKAKGFIRPVRDMYVHVGEIPGRPLRDLIEEEKTRHAGLNYVKYEEYEEDSPIAGRFWTQKMLDSGCGVATSMARSIAETYAKDPKFYGSTYCQGCKTHLPVAEFKWNDGSVVGS